MTADGNGNHSSKKQTARDAAALVKLAPDSAEDQGKRRSPKEIEANERILSARAEKELIEVEQARVSLENARLGIKKIEAEIAFGTENVQLLRANRASAEVATRATERMEKESLASALYQKIYHFTGTVDSRTTRECMARIDIWHNTEPDCAFEIIFSSSGGSVIDGMALFDYIQQMRRAGHHVITSTIGMAASMAGILLQAGDTRRMSAESYLLIHEIATGVSGKIGEIEDEMKFLKKMQGRVLDIFATRSKSSDPLKATKKMTKSQINTAWGRKDWWLDSTEALAHGFVDEIA